MSQAEHDKLASALLVTTSKDFVDKVYQELKRQIDTLSRKEIIEDSLSGIQNAYNSGCNMIIVIDSANKKDEYDKLPGDIKVIDDFTQI